MLRKIVDSLQHILYSSKTILADIRNAYQTQNIEELNRLSTRWSKYVEEHIRNINYNKNSSLDIVYQMSEILSEALITSWVTHFNTHGFTTEPSIFLKHATNIVGKFHVEHTTSAIVPWSTNDEGTEINANKQNLTNMEYIPLLIGLYTCFERDHKKEPRLKSLMPKFIEHYRSNMLGEDYINKKTSAFLYKDYLDGGIKPFKKLPYTDLVQPQPQSKEELISLITDSQYNEECIATPYYLNLLINSNKLSTQYEILDFLSAALINEVIKRTDFMSTAGVEKMEMLSASGLMPQQSTLYTTNPNQIDIETAIDKLISSFDPKISNPYNVFTSMGLSVAESIKQVQKNATLQIKPEELPDMLTAPSDY